MVPVLSTAFVSLTRVNCHCRQAMPDRRAWDDEVDELGTHNAQKLRKYAIAVRTSAAFRHEQLIYEGWRHGDTGHNDDHSSVIVWASFKPELKALGRERVLAAVNVQAEHEARVDALPYDLIHAVTAKSKVIKELAPSVLARMHILLKHAIRTYQRLPTPKGPKVTQNTS